MEDAMIINKGSLERGFAHGQVYKTEVKADFHEVNLLKRTIFQRKGRKLCCVLVNSPLKISKQVVKKSL